ncbi:actin cytoskeleton-regulatory complex protein pan-1-like [Musa acuminata AAA Group]|uniref:actin cytoskeleton-regulatory complex protein pan-1-like n=1 Tax=Musa acuminata AAA Group TaxID=214697 RepID=UPI0031D41938
MSEVFNNQILVEKLTKLNNSQQSIETLSNWCIFHRKKAKEIVETWDQAFSNSPREKRVPFLYLANDILQNSRRKGSEFVNEFWKVLPGCLKNVYENGEDHGKKVVNRLVEIWDERKVFGSRGRGLKDEILGNAPILVSDNGKSTNPIKFVRKDANFVRIKLALGEMPEKIVTAYQSVLDDRSNEDTALSNCKISVQVLEKMEKDVDVSCTQGNQQGSPMIDNLQVQETILKQCIEQLEIAFAARATLVAQLKEALNEQELKLELIHNHLQIAQYQTENTSSMRQRLGLATTTNEIVAGTTLPVGNFASKVTSATEPKISPISITQLAPAQPVTSIARSLSSVEDDHKKAAAAVAAKLAASSSSAQVLTSILSSLAAEEAASMSNGLSSRVVSNSPNFPLEKRPRLENLMSMADMDKTSYFSQVQQPQQQQQTVPLVLPQTSAASMQQFSQSNLAPPNITPPPPPLPPLPPPPMQQYAHGSGATISVTPYGFIGGSLAPPPPLPSNPSLGLTRPGIPPPLPPPPPPPHQQQQPITVGFYQSPGIGFYGQAQTAPTVQRQ